MSLDLVELSLDTSIFVEGQAYVAMSRARTLEGVSLRAFHKDCVKVNPEVQFFYTAPWKVLQAHYSETI